MSPFRRKKTMFNGFNGKSCMKIGLSNDGEGLIVEDGEWSLIYIDCEGIYQCNNLPHDYDTMGGQLIIDGVDLIT